MKFISHRGNLENIVKNEENEPDKILYCISLNYDVEIDVWNIKNNFYLGHDEPQYKIEKEFLLLNSNFFWCHAKNLKALEQMQQLKILNYFWHQKDDFTITSKGYIWTYPGNSLTKNSVAVLPEIVNYSLADLKLSYAICSDSISYFKKAIINE